MDNEQIYFDPYSARYFKSNKDVIDEINRKLNKGLIETFGELYDELGIPCPRGYEEQCIINTDRPIIKN